MAERLSAYRFTSPCDWDHTAKNRRPEGAKSGDLRIAEVKLPGSGLLVLVSTIVQGNFAPEHPIDEHEIAYRQDHAQRPPN